MRLKFLSLFLTLFLISCGQNEESTISNGNESTDEGSLVSNENGNQSAGEETIASNGNQSTDEKIIASNGNNGESIGDETDELDADNRDSVVTYDINSFPGVYEADFPEYFNLSLWITPVDNQREGVYAVLIFKSGDENKIEEIIMNSLNDSLEESQGVPSKIKNYDEGTYPYNLAEGFQLFIPKIKICNEGTYPYNLAKGLQNNLFKFFQYHFSGFASVHLISFSSEEALGKGKSANITNYGMIDLGYPYSLSEFYKKKDDTISITLYYKPWWLGWIRPKFELKIDNIRKTNSSLELFNSYFSSCEAQTNY